MHTSSNIRILNSDSRNTVFGDMNCFTKLCTISFGWVVSFCLKNKQTFYQIFFLQPISVQCKSQQSFLFLKSFYPTFIIFMNIFKVAYLPNISSFSYFHHNNKPVR